MKIVNHMRSLLNLSKVRAHSKIHQQKNLNIGSSNHQKVKSPLIGNKNNEK